MKRIPTSNGPFPIRLYYPEEEIEEICSNALADTDLLPNKPGPIRIDRFIDRKFHAQIIYESLDKGVLGFTEFSPKGVEAVHIAEPTGDLYVQEDRRINSTLAHEAGHCLMHTQLFVEHFADFSPFDNHPDVTQTRILCREEQPNMQTKQREYAGEWWEYQANRAIGALLMPKQLFLAFMQTFLDLANTHTFSGLPIRLQREAIESASHLFDVNQIVVRIRLNSPAF
jgi:Zn-dependent peptidase ImmA (M78 family)